MTAMFTVKRDKILEALGWTVVCESPYEIEHEDGSSASGMAAQIVVDELMISWESYLDEEDILKLKNWLEGK